MNATVATLLLIGILLVLSGLLSASETIITGASRAQMHRRAKEGERRGKLAYFLIQHRQQMIAAILLGNNLVNILASALAASLFLRFFGEAGIVYATLVMTCLVVVLAEILPKSWAIMRPGALLLRWARPMRAVLLILGPPARAGQFLVSLIIRRQDDSSAREIYEELLGTIALHRSSGKKGEDEALMLEGILDLEEIEIADVMVHRTQIKSVCADLPADEALEAILASGHAHVPLWRDAPDNLVGLVHVRDVSRTLLRLGGATSGLDIAGLAQPVWFVPAATSLRRQLSAFLARGTHCAMAVDEYGGLAGLITLNDILEEIIGVAGDEQAGGHRIAGLVKQADGSVLASGQTAVRDCNRALGWSLPDEGAATLAGLVLEEARRLPQEGEHFLIHGVDFEVIQRERRRVGKLKLTPVPQAEEED